MSRVKIKQHSLARQITSHCRIKNAIEYAILDRIIIVGRTGPAIVGRFPYPVCPSSVWNIFLTRLSYRAASDAPEEPGGSGTFYFDIISYFTLKWDKWNCSLPSGVVRIFHRCFSSSRPLAKPRHGTRSNPAPPVVNMILDKIKMFVSSIPLPTREKVLNPKVSGTTSPVRHAGTHAHDRAVDLFLPPDESSRL